MDLNPDESPIQTPFTIRDYTITEIIGTGAFAFVYKATQITSEEIVSIKLIPKSRMTEAGDQERLQREIHAMRLLKHENVVQLLDYFTDENYYYLVIDYCGGGTIFDFLAKGNRPREPQAATCFWQIVSAVDYCHSKGVVHRDLKPQNILITEFPSLKVSDFGLCGYINDGKKMGTFCGSPCYSAPECLNRVEYDGKLSDVWSLGVILFELVTAEHPWKVSNTPYMLQQIAKADYKIPSFVTSACADLIDSLLKINAEERLTTEDILSHPWLKLAAKKPNKTGLPPLNQSLSQINAVLPIRRLSSGNDSARQSDVDKPMSEPLHMSFSQTANVPSQTTDLIAKPRAGLNRFMNSPAKRFRTSYNPKFPTLPGSLQHKFPPT